MMDVQAFELNPDDLCTLNPLALTEQVSYVSPSFGPLPHFLPELLLGSIHSSLRKMPLFSEPDPYGEESLDLEFADPSNPKQKLFVKRAETGSGKTVKDMREPSFSQPAVAQLGAENATSCSLSIRNSLLSFIDVRFVPTGRPALGKVTSGYGWRNVFRRWRMHWGVDIGAPEGTPVYATASGVVSMVRYNSPTAGNYIKLDHQIHLETRYLHLQKILVRPGENVERGQLIGLIGSTGRSTGHHVHYEVLQYGKPVNPKYFGAYNNES